MSYISWNTPTTEAVLAGPEVHYAHHTVGRFAAGFLPFSILPEEDPLRQLLPDDHYLSRPNYQYQAVFEYAYRMQFRMDVGIDTLMSWRGRDLDVFAMQLNTVMQTGSDPLRMLARMAAQGGMHLTIPGEHRAWAADLIEQGLADGLLRTGMGWETPAYQGRYSTHSVVSLLRDRADEPVVLASSTNSSWPNADVGDWMPAWPEGVDRDFRLLTEEQQAERHARADAWEELTEAEQWEHCLTGWDTLPQLTPDTLGRRFVHGLSVLDLDAHDWQNRLDSALGVERGTG